MAENFDLIFGQNASQQYAWNDSDYQNGWETIGNIPPTAAQFDALQRRSDTKMNELNDELTPLVNAETADNRQPSTAYSEGDIKYSPLLPTGWFLACTVSGTSSASELVVPSPVAEGDEITDGGVTWKVKKIGGAGDAGDGVPLGAILPLAHNSTIPAGYLLCDGSAVSRTMFPDLFSAIGTTYGAGDGSTTFNVPDYNSAKRFAQGSTVAGTVKSAGLPNIEGSATYATGYGLLDAGVGGDDVTGAFVLGQTQPNRLDVVSDRIGRNLGFDASAYNPIYGASNTVQPDALTCRYIIKAFDGQTADSALIDITQYAQELSGKANITGSNLVHHRDVITTSGTYTAPATGLYKITVKGGGGGGGGVQRASSNNNGGGGGGEGGTTIVYKLLTINDTVAVVIGAGGAGVAGYNSAAGDGGNSSVTIDGTAYVGGGGGGGNKYADGTMAVSVGGFGGSGTIPGQPGATAHKTMASGDAAPGGTGGGNGAGVGAYAADGIDADANSGAGGGGAGGNSTTYVGGDGGDGYVWFEYYTPGAN